MHGPSKPGCAKSTVWSSFDGSGSCLEARDLIAAQRQDMVLASIVTDAKVSEDVTALLLGESLAGLTMIEDKRSRLHSSIFAIVSPVYRHRLVCGV